MEAKARMDCRYHPSIVPPTLESHFSFELYAKATGGMGPRSPIMCGRFGVIINRDNEWIFMIVEGIFELNIRVAPVVMDQWEHLVGTFDGTTFRCYLNSVLTTQIETEAAFKFFRQQKFEELEDKKMVRYWSTN